MFCLVVEYYVADSSTYYHRDVLGVFDTRGQARDEMSYILSKSRQTLLDKDDTIKLSIFKMELDESLLDKAPLVGG